MVSKPFRKSEYYNRIWFSWTSALQGWTASKPRRIRELSPGCKIIFLTGHLNPEIVQAALEAGGCGYVHKEDAATELLLSLESVLAGKQCLSQSIAGLDDVT